MGKRGPQPKSPERRQTRREVGHSDGRKVELQAVPPAFAEPPKPGKGWRKETRDAWAEYWQSDVSLMCQPAQLPALRRLFGWYDERSRLFDAIGEELMLEGSKGQPQLNPLYQRIKAIEDQLPNLEGEFGLSPAARAQLGISVSDAKKSLNDLNERARKRVMQAEHEPDPRFAEVLEPPADG